MENKDINNEIPSIFKVFSDMNNKYVDLVRSHHKVALSKDKYNPQYIREDRTNTLTAIRSLKKGYIEAANQAIQQIKDEYSEQPPAIEEPKTEQGMLQRELQRSNNLSLWQRQMEVATVDELRAMHQEHKWDKDFTTLLKTELRKRADQPVAALFKYEIENPPENPLFKNINAIEKGLNSLASMDNMYPQSLAETGLDDLKLRSVAQDLDTVMEQPAFNL